MISLRPLWLVAAFTILNVSAFAQDSFMVKLQDVEDRKAVLATVQTEDLTPARARIGGIVSELLVDEGTGVDRAQVMALVIDEKLNLEKQAVEARQASLQAERELADIALKRAEQLRRTGAGSQAKLDEARTNLDVVVKNLKAMESERELVLQREREGAILSPAKGRVISVKVTSGQVVMPGEPIAIVAEENYILRIEVPERHARFIHVGDEVSVGDRGMSVKSEALRKGVVVQVYPEIQRGRVVADIQVEGLGDYFIGERVRVFVSTGTRKAFLVPDDYIYNRYGLNYVKLASGVEVVVQPGSMIGEMREILSGLRDGDEIVKGAS